MKMNACRTNLTFTTTDFLLASFLIANDIQLLGQRRDGRRVTFEFDELDRCTLLENSLLIRDDNISASRLNFAMRTLKKIIYEGG
jgi:hypothetical protein